MKSLEQIAKDVCAAVNAANREMRELMAAEGVENPTGNFFKLGESRTARYRLVAAQRRAVTPVREN